MSRISVLITAYFVLIGCENWEEHSTYVRVSDRIEHGWFVDKVSKSFASGWAEIHPLGWTGVPSIGVGAKDTAAAGWSALAGTPIPGPRQNTIARADIRGPGPYDAFVFEMPSGVAFETVLFYVPFPAQMPPEGQMPALSQALFCPDPVMSSCMEWRNAVLTGLIDCVDELGTPLPSSDCVARPPYVRWYALDAGGLPVAARETELRRQRPDTPR